MQHDPTLRFLRKRPLRAETLEARCVLTAGLIGTPFSLFHNPIAPADVNNDGHVSAADLFNVVTEIRDHGPREINSAKFLREGIENAPRGLVDASGDGRVTLQDVLDVVNRLREELGEDDRPTPVLDRLATFLEHRIENTPPLHDRLADFLEGLQGHDDSPLREHLERLRERWGDRDDAIRERLQRLRDAIGEGVDSLREHLRDLIEEHQGDDTTNPPTGSIPEDGADDSDLADFRERLEQVLDSIVSDSDLRDRLDAVLEQLRENYPELGESVQDLFDSLIERHDEIEDRLREFLESLEQSETPLRDQLRELLGDLRDETDTFRENLRDFLGALENSDSPIREELRALIQAVQDRENDLRDALRQFVDGLEGDAAEWLDRWTDLIGTLQAPLFDVGESFVDLFEENDWAELADHFFERLPAVERPVLSWLEYQRQRWT